MTVFLFAASDTGNLKLDTEMIHDESWKPIYFKVRG